MGSKQLNQFTGLVATRKKKRLLYAVKVNLTTRTQYRTSGGLLLTGIVNRELNEQLKD